MRRLIIGCGYLGLRAGRLWRDAGDDVIATTRGGRRDVLIGAGFTPLVVDITQPAGLRLPAVDTILFAAARDGEADAWTVYRDGLRHVLDAAAAPAHVIHISSTGVYTEDGGQWVDEDAPAAPVRDAPRALLAAETLLREHPLGRTATILRLAGLYGGDRLPLRRSVLAGRVIPGSPGAWLNFIHADDAAAAVVAAAARPPAAAAVINVADGRPVLRAAYVAAVAATVGQASPGFSGGTGLGKRVRNTRLVHGLGVTPRVAPWADAAAPAGLE